MSQNPNRGSAQKSPYLWIALGIVCLLLIGGVSLYRYLKPAQLVVASPQKAAAAMAAYLNDPPPPVNLESELGAGRPSQLALDVPPPVSRQVTAARVAKPRTVTNHQATFRCEKKVRCPQMTSCEEAMFYLDNCPWPMMDGDGDGIPCEDQWCEHIAR